MACTQTLAGLFRDCAANLGGIKTVYLANFDDVATITVSLGVVTAITMETSKKFYEYQFNPNTSNFTTTVQANRENGSLYFESVLSLVFAKLFSAAWISKFCIILNRCKGHAFGI